MDTIYWVIVEVYFDKPISNDDQGISDTVGFLQTFGCTASTEGLMKDWVCSNLFGTPWLKDLNPNIEFDISTINRMDVEKELLLDQEINAYFSSSPYEDGLWYQSGRTYFHDDDEESDDESGYLVEIVPAKPQ